MADQKMVKVTVPTGNGNFTTYEAPAESEMNIREVYANLPPSEQIKIKIEPILSGEEQMRIAIEEQSEIERLKSELAELKVKYDSDKTKTNQNKNA